MVPYSIHVIVKYNQAGSEIICRQIFVHFSVILQYFLSIYAHLSALLSGTAQLGLYQA